MDAGSKRHLIRVSASLSYTLIGRNASDFSVADENLSPSCFFSVYWARNDRIDDEKHDKTG